MISRTDKREITMNISPSNENTDLKNGYWSFEYGFTQFARYCKIKNLRKKTIKDYSENFTRFIRFMEEHSTHTNTGSITANDIDNYILYLRSTGMKETSVDILSEYLMFRKGEDDDYLFCNQYGEQATTDSIKHAITKYNKTHGVNRTSLHAFRHTFAKKCVLNNVNVFVLQRLLGHTDIKVTKEYVDLYADDLAVNIDKYNPLDTFGKTMSTQTTKKSKSRTKKINMR